MQVLFLFQHIRGRGMPLNNLGDISFDNSGQQQAHNVGHVSMIISVYCES